MSLGRARLFLPTPSTFHTTRGLGPRLINNPVFGFEYVWCKPRDFLLIRLLLCNQSSAYKLYSQSVQASAMPFPRARQSLEDRHSHKAFIKREVTTNDRMTGTTNSFDFSPKQV